MNDAFSKTTVSRSDVVKQGFDNFKPVAIALGLERLSDLLAWTKLLEFLEVVMPLAKDAGITETLQGLLHESSRRGQRMQRGCFPPRPFGRRVRRRQRRAASCSSSGALAHPQCHSPAPRRVARPGRRTAAAAVAEEDSDEPSYASDSAARGAQGPFALCFSCHASARCGYASGAVALEGSAAGGRRAPPLFKDSGPPKRQQAQQRPSAVPGESSSSTALSQKNDSQQDVTFQPRLCLPTCKDSCNDTLHTRGLNDGDFYVNYCGGRYNSQDYGCGAVLPASYATILDAYRYGPLEEPVNSLLWSILW
jgi:hypothetical protein